MRKWNIYLNTIFLTLSFIFSFYYNSYAQEFMVKWIKDENFTKIDNIINYIRGNNLILDDENNQYSIIIPSEINTITLTKRDIDGNIIWQQNLSKYFIRNSFIPYNQSLGFGIDKVGNIYIAGVTESVNGLKPKNEDNLIFALLKLTKDGDFVWIKGFGEANKGEVSQRETKSQIQDLSIDALGNIYIYGYFFNNITLNVKETTNTNGNFFVKLNNNGNFVWSKIYPFTHDFSYGKERDKLSMAVDNSGNLYFTGVYEQEVLKIEAFELNNPNGGKNSTNYIAKYNPNGDLAWVKNINQEGYVSDAKLTVSNSMLYLGGTVNNKDNLGSSICIIQLNNLNGSINWAVKSSGRESLGSIHSMQVDCGGNLYMLARFGNYITWANKYHLKANRISSLPSDIPSFALCIVKISSGGEVNWAKAINSSNSFTFDNFTHQLYVNKNGLVNILGNTGSSTISIGEDSKEIKVEGNLFSILIKDAASCIESSKVEDSNLIKGMIYHDTNNNCRFDEGEQGIGGVIIKAGDYFGITNDKGGYSIFVDKGDYKITQIIPKKKLQMIESVCNIEYQANFQNNNETKSGFDFFNKVENCTALTVDLASDRRRRCFRSQTTVTYKNEGYADAQNVQIKVIYPKYVVPIRSTQNWVSRQDSLLTFNIGALKAGETGRFVITDSVVCGNESIRGLTQCTKAIISPASSCIQESAAWDKASIEVNGYCEGDYANFSIKNVGRGDMRDSTTYRIFFDAVLVEEKKVKLKSNESLPLLILGKGRAIRLEASQVPNHPTESEPNTTIEACGRRVIFTRAENAVRQLPQDNKSEHSQTSCMPIIDSYDPNDKQVAPLGVTERNFIKNTDLLEYLVRFQNTGSDTAYTVVIRDTLSKSLDVSSLVVGASSHNYTWSISGKGNPIITFTFNNIYLPHAKVNESGSNGFVKFKIRQTTNNPIGTKITNKAGIYFDFNSPIITNEVLNEIGDPIIRQVGRAENLADITVCDANAMPSTSQAGNAQTIATDRAELSANVPQKGIGMWRVVSGTGRIANLNNAKAQVTNLSEGENVFEWTITLCGKSSKSQVRINRIRRATVSSSGNTLTASEGESYQWYKDGQAIAGATGRTFTPTVAGTYTVIVIVSGLSTTSEPINITGVEDTLLSRSVKLYPNPAQNYVVVDFNFAEKGNLKITLIDYLGRKVHEETVKKQEQNLTYSLETNHLPEGLYLFVFEIGEQRGVKRVVKE